MEQNKEAVYLINNERYLHLRENDMGVGFATYNKVTGEPLESGQISEKNLPPDGRNAIAAARNWYLFELSDDDRKAIQLESVKILETIPQAGIGRRRIWEPETIPPDIRLINSYYDDLHRIPDGGVIQVDYPDGRSFTSRLEYLDDYHFDMGGLGNVFHITTVHHGINVCPVHEFFQNRKLLFGAGRHKVLPLLRQDGQVRDAPLHILLPIGTGRRKFHQMPHAPAYDIAAALKVAILPPMHS